MPKIKASSLFKADNMGFFSNKKEQTLGDLENTLERKKTEREIAEEEEAIQELRARGRKWQDFSPDGSRKKFSLSSAIQWIKTH